MAPTLVSAEMICGATHAASEDRRGHIEYALNRGCAPVQIYHLTPVSAFHIAVISYYRHLETLLSWESFGGTLTNIAEGLCMCIDNVNFEVGSICRSLGLRIIEQIR